VAEEAEANLSDGKLDLQTKTRVDTSGVNSVNCLVQITRPTSCDTEAKGSQLGNVVPYMSRGSEASV
jgi:hypothetical protein